METAYAPAGGRTGEPARNPPPRNENAAGGEPAAQDQSRAPTGSDADRQGHYTAAPESEWRHG